MIARILIALVLGALSTWSIATLCALQSPNNMVSGAAGATAPTWIFRQWRAFGHISENYSPCFNDREILSYEGPKPKLVPSWSRMNHAPVEGDFTPEARSYVYWNESGLGWPLCTFIHTTDYDGRFRGAGNYVVTRSGAMEWTFRGRVVFVPYSPRLAGFAPTALVLALSWFALISAPRTLRNRRRRRRGLCMYCGYDLKSGNSSGGVCPECGR